MKHTLLLPRTCLAAKYGPLLGVIPETACGFGVSSAQLHEGHFKGQLCVVFLSMMFFTSAVFGHTLQAIPVLPCFERTRGKTAGLRNAMSFQTCTVFAQNLQEIYNAQLLRNEAPNILQAAGKAYLVTSE